jgi:protein-S-isoprenylcysteine O-methyltransferase Ste14
MDTARHVIALMILVGFPVGILLWFFIHPFAAFWRRLGPVWTYVIVSVPGIAVATGMVLVRGRLLAVEFGTSTPLIGLAAVCAAGGLILALKRRVCAAGGLILALKRRRYLTPSILSGIPEISEKSYPGKLLTEGIYAKIRHPRYLEAVLFSLGYALIANYLAVYVLVILIVPALYLVVLLEERELRQRFGAEYEEYCRRVPRFLPRMG